jgi:uncharacterized iron-regulated membrane protein
MVVCFTGAVLVFEKEFQRTLYPERYFVEPTADRIILDSVVHQFEEQVKGSSVTGLKLYADPSRSVEVSYAEKKGIGSNLEIGGKEKKTANKVDAKGKGSEAPRNKQAFVDPYRGDLISLYDSRSGFFFTMFSLHRWLLMGDTGKLIVGISTSIFLFIIITGLILWWPATRAKLKQHLTLKWGGWKRINHDLHIVIGFYTSIFLFAFAFTGLAWSFEWFNNGIYWVTGTENKRPDPPSSVYQANARTVSFEHIYTAIKEQVPQADYFQIVRPKDSISTFTVTVMPADAIHERASDQYFFDQYTGELAGTSLFQERNLGQRVRSTFYPVHVGSIGGLPGRIIAFLSCVAGFTFPITGLILWLNRLKKEKKKRAKEARKQKKEKAVTLQAEKSIS